MGNYFDQELGDWVTDWSRYKAVLGEPQFAAIRDRSIWREPPERIWSLVVALVHAVPEDTLHYVGAGPLEDLVHSHAAALIDRIEQDLPRDSRLQSAMLEINLERGVLPLGLETRFVAAIGPKFSLLEPPLPNER